MHKILLALGMAFACCVAGAASAQGGAPATTPFRQTNSCASNYMCSEALARSIAASAWATQQGGAVARPDNGSLCNPAGCIVMVCTPADSSNCIIWWCGASAPQCVRMNYPVVNP